MSITLKLDIKYKLCNKFILVLLCVCGDLYPKPYRNSIKNQKKH